MKYHYIDKELIIMGNKSNLFEFLLRPSDNNQTIHVLSEPYLD